MKRVAYTLYRLDCVQNIRYGSTSHRLQQVGNRKWHQPVAGPRNGAEKRDDGGGAENAL